MSFLARAGAVPAWALLGICGGLGAVAALGLAPFGIWAATLVALSALFLIFAHLATPGHAAMALWAFSAGYFGFGLRWLLEPFQVDAQTYGWMAPFALALMTGGLASFAAAAGWTAHRLSRSAQGRVAALVLTLSVAEFARAFVFTGFPWAGLAQVWIDTSAAQMLAWVGPHGLSLLTLVAAGGPVLLLQSRFIPVLVFAPPLLLTALFGMIGTPRLPSIPDGAPVVRVVQPDAPQHEKWDPDKAPTFFWRQIEATRADAPPDLIVWPETAIPQLLNSAADTLEIVAEAARGAPVAVGMQRFGEGGYYNSLIVVDEDGAIGDIYDKHHLVPFGEYMPFGVLFRNLGIQALAQRVDAGYAAGPGPQIITAGRLRAQALICYEAVFPRFARAAGPRPDLILQATNDAWFGTGSGPQQHLAQARMRAIEQGLPLVRSANTGISAVIGPRGQIVAQLGLGEAGYAQSGLPAPRPTPFYARTGDWPAGVVLTVLAALGAVRRLRGTKSD